MRSSSRPTYTSTPAGICEAARAGDVHAIERILLARPNLLTVNNPYNWSKTIEEFASRTAVCRKPVEIATFFNHPDAVARLVEISRDSEAIKGPFCDFLPFDGHFNALKIAHHLKHFRIVEVLQHDTLHRIEIEPQTLNLADGDGRTTLHYAVEQGDMSLAAKLLDLGAACDPTLNTGRRVLHTILDHGNRQPYLEIARRILDNGAKEDVWIATAMGNTQRVSELLERNPQLAGTHYRPDRSMLSDGFPLVRACALGHQSIVRLLLDAKADVNARVDIESCPEFGMPIIAAVYGGHVEIANYLLDHGASVHAHPNCAAPLVDMLYCAQDSASEGWLALQELRYATKDPRHAFQPIAARTTQLRALYQRVCDAGAKPQMYSVIKMNDTQAFTQRIGSNPDSSSSTQNAASIARWHLAARNAAWLGQVAFVKKCLDRLPPVHTGTTANACIEATIRSHNRDGSFEQYRHIIELNLRFLRERGDPITILPLHLLATDFLENHRYGRHPQLPSIADLLTLAELFITFGINVDECDPTSGRTALAEAVDQGHTEFVALLLRHGATTLEPTTPHTSPIHLARQHGFHDIATLLGDTNPIWGELHPTDLVPFHPAPPAELGPKLTKLSHTMIQLGSVTMEYKFQPKGQFGDAWAEVFEFPDPFPSRQFGNVTLIITNRDQPQIVGSATTGMKNGKQGFLLKAHNSDPSHVVNGAAGNATTAYETCRVSFSWMAMLPTNQRQAKQFQVRFGLVPFRAYREFPGPGFTFSGTGDLYADTPLTPTTSERFVFLTTTVSGAANSAAAIADDLGIPRIDAHQTGHHEGGCRLHWMVIAEYSPTVDATAAVSNTGAKDRGAYFDTETLFLQTNRVSPRLQPDWQDEYVPMLKHFRERSPCVFVTPNRHGIQGHHASVVGMSWACRRDEFLIKSRSFDTILGESNFDYLAIGHCDASADEIAAANEVGIPVIDPWKRYNDWNASQLVAEGHLDPHEFGPHGGSLFLHCIYERFQMADLRKLLTQGADVNQKQPGTNLTGLHIAAAFGRTKAANLLVERGADVNARTTPETTWTFPPNFDLRSADHTTHRGETPLHFAMRYRKFPIVRILLNAGADPNPEDVDGNRPIDCLRQWAVYPDNSKHWELINRRTLATKDDYLSIIDWIESEND